MFGMIFLPSFQNLTRTLHEKCVSVICYHIGNHVIARIISIVIKAEIKVCCEVTKDCAFSGAIHNGMKPLSGSAS